MLVPMAKVEIIGPKSRFFDVVSLLHEQGKLHIEDLSKKIQSGEVPLDRMEVRRAEVTEHEQLEELLIRVRAILKRSTSREAAIDPEARKRRVRAPVAARRRRARRRGRRGHRRGRGAHVGPRASCTRRLEAELALLARYEPILHKIQPLAKQIVVDRRLRHRRAARRAPLQGRARAAQGELDKITHKQCEIVSTDVDEDTTAAIVVFDRQYAEPVHKFLAMENVNQIRLPRTSRTCRSTSRTNHQAAPAPTARRARGDPRGARGDVEQVVPRSSPTIRDVLVDQIDEIVAIPKFGRTEYAFVITAGSRSTTSRSSKTIAARAVRRRRHRHQLEINEEDFAERRSR